MIRGGARCWVRPGEPRPRESLLLCTNIRFSDSHNMRVRSIPLPPQTWPFGSSDGRAGLL